MASPPSQGSEGGVGKPTPVLTSKRLSDLVAMIDGSQKLDAGVEEVLLEVLDDWVENLATFAASLARHRGSDTVEAKDVLLYLKKNWDITVPGYESAFPMARTVRPALSVAAHRSRLQIVHREVAKKRAASEAAMAAAQQEVEAAAPPATAQKRKRGGDSAAGSKQKKQRS